MRFDPPLVSIIIPVLNGATTLRQCLNSIKEQDYPKLELIVIDGGSTDATVDILRENNDQITQWNSEPDDGVYDAMNKGIKVTSGDWVYFLGADDVLLNGFSRIIESFREHNTIYYGDVIMPVRNRLYDGRFSAYKLACRNICHQSAFYPRAVLDKHTFNLKYTGLADYELNMRCFGDPDIRFEYIPETVARFQDNRGISQMRPDTIFDQEKLLLVKKNFPASIYYVIVIRTALMSLLKRARMYEAVWKIKNQVARINRR